MTITELISSLDKNPMFGAVVGGFGIGVGAAYLRRGYQIGKFLFQRHCQTSLEITSKDKSYDWVLGWIIKNTKHTLHRSVNTTFNQLNSAKAKVSFNYMPSPGTHIFNYKGKWIRVERLRDQSIDLMGNPFETVKLNCLGRNNPILESIVDDATGEALQLNYGKTAIYNAMGLEWREHGQPRELRPWKSVILDKDKAEQILKDVNNFIESSERYSKRGRPYRRGYLLYGPPGTGKTSFVKALAGKLEYSICTLKLGERGLTDDRLNCLMMQVPPQSIVLIEDIDSVFVSKNESSLIESAYDGRVTFSGLLNMLDGVDSSEPRILFMTTNNKNRLDQYPALIRRGRIDVKMEIGYATPYQMKKAFQQFFYLDDGNVNELAEQFAHKLTQKLKNSNLNISMAQIQGYFDECEINGLDTIGAISDEFMEKFIEEEFKESKKKID